MDQTNVVIETMGVRVKRLRMALQLTQEEVVQTVPGMSASALSQLESGKSRGVRPENLIELARALKVSPEELVYGSPGENGRGDARAAA